MPTHLPLPGPSADAACTIHVVACDSVRDCVFLKDDLGLNRVKKGLNSYELNFSLPNNSQNKSTKLN